MKQLIERRACALVFAKTAAVCIVLAQVGPLALAQYQLPSVESLRGQEQYFYPPDGQQPQSLYPEVQPSQFMQPVVQPAIYQEPLPYQETLQRQFIYPEAQQSFPPNQYSQNASDRVERFINHDYVPPISAHLLAHSDVYRPSTFTMRAVKPNPYQVVIEFNYTRFDHYNKYSMHVRYHGHEDREMTTKRLDLDKRAPNRIVLKKFLEAQYIICIGLYAPPSTRVPPLSTSDMCVDVFVGEDRPRIGKHHNKTGLLMPALLVLVCIHLVAIAFIYEARKAKIHKRLRCLQTSKKEAEKAMKEKTTKALDYFLNKQENDELKFTKVLLYYDDDEDFYYEPPREYAHAFTPYNSSQSSSSSGRNSSLASSTLHSSSHNEPHSPTKVGFSEQYQEKQSTSSSHSSGSDPKNQLPHLRLQDLNFPASAVNRNNSGISFIQLQNEVSLARNRPRGSVRRYQTQNDVPSFY